MFIMRELAPYHWSYPRAARFYALNGKDFSDSPLLDHAGIHFSGGNRWLASCTVMFRLQQRSLLGNEGWIYEDDSSG